MTVDATTTEKLGALAEQAGAIRADIEREAERIAGVPNAPPLAELARLARHLEDWLRDTASTAADDRG